MLQTLGGRVAGHLNHLQTGLLFEGVVVESASSLNEYDGRTFPHLTGDAEARIVGTPSFGHTALLQSGKGFRAEISPLIFVKPFVPPEVRILSGDFGARLVQAENYSPTGEIPVGLIFSGQAVRSTWTDYATGPRLEPSLYDLEALSGEVELYFYIWNWRNDDVVVESLGVFGDSGMEVVSPVALPFVIGSKKRLKFSVIVRTTGAAVIDATVEAEISQPYTATLKSFIRGIRVAPLFDIPEMPVEESWQWLTNNMRGVDGTEQRVSLRGTMPRIEQKVKYVVQTLQGIRKFQQNIYTSQGRAWMPEFQYSVFLDAPSAAGATKIYYNNDHIDIRENERVLIYSESGQSAVVQIRRIDSDGATLVSPLRIGVNESFKVTSGSAAILDEGFSLGRKSVDTNAEFKMTGRFQRVRATLSNPAKPVELEMYQGRVVLNRRPLANEDVVDSVATGNDIFDNNTGVFDALTLWEQSKVTTNVSILFNRYKIGELDYFKAVFDEIQGASRKFWLPSFRNDLQAVGTSSGGVVTVEDVEYATVLYSMKNYRFLQVQLANGSVYNLAVTSAVSLDGNSRLTTTGMPIDTQTITRISFLRPVRMANDEVQLKHFFNETLLSFSVIDAE